MRNYFTFGGESSADHGVYISGAGTYNAPVKVYDMVPVAGRNGDLALSGGRYENIELTYSAFLHGDATAYSFADNMADLRAFLSAPTGYQRLEDTYNPDEYRLGIFRSGLDVDATADNKAGTFDITFDCKPQRFLKSGETVTTFTTNGNITNPTAFEAKPLLKVTGYGTLGVGDRSVIITGTAGQVIYIDCEIMEAWSLNGSAIIPRNDYVQYVGNKFPVLASGVNGISMSGNITRVEVTPRWWRL